MYGLAAGRHARTEKLAALVLLCGLLADVLTKSWAVAAVADAPLTLGAFSLEVVGNPAFAFSLGEGAFGDGVVAVVRALGLLLIVAFLRTAVVVDQALRTLTGYALVAAGGLGNTLDHVTQNGEVIDFIAVRAPGDSAAVAFNMADVWIVVGLTLLYPAIRAFARRISRRGRPLQT
jgi:signal peptidase II